MRPLQPREKVILWALAALVVAVGFYYGVYAPKTAEIATVSKNLKSAQDELTRLRAAAARKDQLEARLRDLQHAVEETEAKLPPSREIPTLLVQLEGMASQVGANLTLIRPGPAQAQGGAGQPARSGAPPSTAAAPGLGLQQFTLQLEADGTFDTVQSFVRGIENFPRFVAMSDMKISPISSKPGENPDKPRLALSVSATTYFVPEGSPQR